MIFIRYFIFFPYLEFFCILSGPFCQICLMCHTQTLNTDMFSKNVYFYYVQSEQIEFEYTFSDAGCFLNFVKDSEFYIFGILVDLFIKLCLRGYFLLHSIFSSFCLDFKYEKNIHVKHIHLKYQNLKYTSILHSFLTTCTFTFYSNQKHSLFQSYKLTCNICIYHLIDLQISLLKF